MPTSVKELMAAANAAVPRIGREEAAALIQGGDVLVVDVRDAPELQAGGKVKEGLGKATGDEKMKAEGRADGKRISEAVKARLNG